MENNPGNETETNNICCGVGKLGISEGACVDCGTKDNSEGCKNENKNDRDNTGITREDITLPECFKGKLAFVLRNVFSDKECKDYIKKTEKMGYEDALVNVGGGRQRMMKDVRNNTRCIWDSFEEADRIWQRIKKYIPETWESRKVMALNERLRFLKYDPGEYFAPHMDGMYIRPNGEKSYITIQLYLNEGFEGGSTTFMNFAEKERVEVVPETGMVLVFQHDIMHEGSALIKGRKYSMRTDVMYSAQVC
ncbi:uncharacterized protein LOC123556340 [Mercenaria mercenaria]|uniref:uncharacterized protein LOC123556340 n=1 Tax=Mercenaria mercenaria TaxID=6596 RepID=UPI00234FAD28|nr:uncharacterized protein LOC123556340 [Mercenaria mercenaria]